MGERWPLAGRFPGPLAMKPRRVCRNLFGAVDRGELRKELQREMQNSLEEASIKWNFDFGAERPLAGALQWEAVRSQELPLFYRSFVVGGSTGQHVTGLRSMGKENAASQREGETSGEHRTEKAVKCPGTLHTAQHQANGSCPCSHKRRQSVITDYYIVKRKSVRSVCKPQP
uniref:Serine and arginine rich splicing factor 3b n=1 Tax=Callorhinchus milii TaxID=7868 RepID=V9KXZ7_CALMI